MQLISGEDYLVARTARIWWTKRISDAVDYQAGEIFTE